VTAQDTIGGTMNVGTIVKTTMGLALRGKVIDPIPKSQYTDGQYREPEDIDDDVTYVQWDNGTKGWIPGCFIIEITEGN